MKKTILGIILPLLCLYANAQNRYMVIHLTDGTTAKYPVSSIDCVTVDEIEESITSTYTINGIEYPMPEAVDLGLPSGTKWANMNIGATSPYGYGYNFRWGEVIPNINTTYSLPSYILDGSQCYLKDNDNVVKYYLGDEWDMPNAEELGELAYTCTHETSCTSSGEKYVTFTGPNGNSIIVRYVDNCFWANYFNPFYVPSNPANEVNSPCCLYYCSSTDTYINIYSSIPQRGVIRK